MSDPARQQVAAAEPCDPELQHEIELAIEACGGNLRDTIMGLMVLTKWQEAKIARLEAVASVGYMRGKIGKPPEPPEDANA